VRVLVALRVEISHLPPVRVRQVESLPLLVVKVQVWGAESTLFLVCPLALEALVQSLSPPLELFLAGRGTLLWQLGHHRPALAQSPCLWAHPLKLEGMFVSMREKGVPLEAMS